VARCYVYDGSDVAGKDSFADVQSSEVHLDQLHLFTAQSQFKKMGVLRTTKYHQLVFQFGGYMNIDFRGTSKEATHIVTHVSIEPHFGGRFSEDVGTVYEIGKEYGYLDEQGAKRSYDRDPRLLLSFKIPFAAIGDPVYGRLMFDEPAPRNFGS
jgi:hypothetical protein